MKCKWCGLEMVSDDFSSKYVSQCENEACSRVYHTYHVPLTGCYCGSSMGFKEISSGSEFAVLPPGYLDEEDHYGVAVDGGGTSEPEPVPLQTAEEPQVPGDEWGAQLPTYQDIKEARFEDWFAAGYVFWHDPTTGALRCADAEWQTFFSESGAETSPPPPGTYKVLTRNGSETRPLSAQGGTSASGGSTGVASELETAVARCATRGWLDDGWKFFLDGGVLRVTMDWAAFYDSESGQQLSDYEPAASSVFTYKSATGTFQHELFQSGETSRERKRAERASKRAQPTQNTSEGEGGALVVGGAAVRVNGCTLFLAGTGLEAINPETNVRHTVHTPDGTRVLNETGIQVGAGEKVTRDGEPLSLDEHWIFHFNTIISDVDCYLTAARALFFTQYGYAEGNGQCYHYLPGKIGEYNAHVSVTLGELNKLLRGAMTSGNAPGPGFLRGQSFHVTVEMYGPSNSLNPRAFDRGQWQGKIGALRMTAAQAYERGDNYLKNNV